MDTSWPALDEALLTWCGAGDWRVFGRRLRPLTLLHRELLRMAVPGLITGEPAGIPEVDLAARICSMDPWRAGAWLGKTRKARWQRWLERLDLMIRSAWYRKHLTAQWETMREYLEASRAVPEMMIREEKAQKGVHIPDRRAPPFLDLVVALSQAGWDARDVAGRYPAALVEWIFQTVASQQGGRVFVTEELRELMAKARKDRALTDPDPAPVDTLQGRVVALIARVRSRPATRGGDSPR